jgi:protein-S-isoprenylcysteine O-methyltransferase Ste14
VFLGLAVLGWDGFGPFFAHPPFVALTVITFALGLSAIFTAGTLSSGKREDRGNRWVLAAFGALGVLQAWLPAYTDRAGILTLDGEALRWAGVAIYAVGGVLRIWPVYVLGRRFSGLVAIQAGHELVTTGVYRFVRNPSYVGLLATVLGWVLAFRSGGGLVLFVLTLAPVIGRIRAEERLLSSEFGPAWDAYAARTWRLIPFVY